MFEATRKLRWNKITYQSTPYWKLVKLIFCNLPIPNLPKVGTIKIVLEAIMTSFFFKHLLTMRCLVLSKWIFPFESTTYEFLASKTRIRFILLEELLNSIFNQTVFWRSKESLLYTVMNIIWKYEYKYIISNIIK